MDELKAVTAFEGLLPVQIGAVSLEEADLGALTSISALGDRAKLAEALHKHHGLALPDPNRATGKEGARCIWFGHREVLLAGPQAHAALGDVAALVDVSDGWGALAVAGADAVEVLARLVPVDLRAAHFKRGHTLRTQVGHMAASITRTGPDRLVIMVFRSMAATLVTELSHAMEAVAARR